MPKISILMSVKNGSSDLQKSIDSILKQSFQNFEFIICDDGSTDNTLSILNEYKEKDNRIVVLHNETSQGLAFSLNRCIEISKSNILARQDADDFSEPERLEKQYEFVLEHPEYAIVGTSYYKVDNTGNRLKECFPTKCPTALEQVQGGHYMHPSWMMRKDMLQKVGFYTVNKYTMRSQDYHLVMKLLGAGYSIYNMQELLYDYTIDEKTMMRSRNWKRVKGLMWIRWDAYRRNHLPLWCYIYVFKPVITNLIPQKIMFWHYKRKFKP